MAQQHKVHEVIVVDDGSEDQTQALLDDYPQIIRIKHARNKGVSAARNTGLKAASSDWLALLDSDDEWMEDKLSKQLEAVSNQPDVKIFHTDEIWIRDGKRVNAMHKHTKPDGWVFEKSLSFCCVSPSSVLMHKSVLRGAGEFDESLPACEDYDLWLRLFHRYKVALIPLPLVIKYGGHSDQLSTQYWGMDRFRVKTLQKLLDSHVLSTKNTDLTYAMLQEKCEILRNGAQKRGHYDRAKYYAHLPKQYAQSVP